MGQYLPVWWPAYAYSTLVSPEKFKSSLESLYGNSCLLEISEHIFWGLAIISQFINCLVLLYVLLVYGNI